MISGVYRTLAASPDRGLVLNVLPRGVAPLTGWGQPDAGVGSGWGAHVRWVASGVGA